MLYGPNADQIWLVDLIDAAEVLEAAEHGLDESAVGIALLVILDRSLAITHVKNFPASSCLRLSSIYLHTSVG